MSEEPNTLRELLNRFQNCTDSFAEHNISSAISELVKKDQDRKPTKDEIAENMAFNFCEHYSNEETGWGTYYGPMMTGSDQDGGTWETPSIKDINEDVLNYWTTRAESAQHSILKTRYADLVWDLKRKVTHVPPSIDMARIVIDNTERMAIEDCHRFDNSVVTKLGRALSIAIAIKDSERTGNLANTIILYESTRHGHMGFSFDLLIDSEKVALSSESERGIIDHLEDHLDEIVNSKDVSNVDPWTAEHSAIRLARYYRKLGRHDDVKRILVKCGGIFIKAADGSKKRLLASGYLQHMHSVFLEFGLREEAEDVTIRLRAIGDALESEMATISHEISIPNEDLKKLVSAAIDGDLESTLFRIAALYIPTKDQAEKQIREISKNSPILSLIPRQMVDDRGRIVAVLGPLEEDRAGHIVFQISQTLTFSSFILREVISGLSQKPEANSESIFQHITRSPAFLESKYEIIRKGIEACLDGDHITAAHLLVPQFEDAVRTILEKLGGSVLKKGRNGGFQLKLLDEMLRDPLTVKCLGEDLSLYFRILYTDQRGWNVRNSICHGMLPSNAIGASITDRILHSLLCLALVREDESNNGE